MIILGIETSCDETAASLVEDGTATLSNVVASSVEMHSRTGGIIPENAAREQIKAMIPVIEQAMDDTKLRAQDIDAIAVTVGPGLIGSLLVGVETARTLSALWTKPIIPVNHLLAHIFANYLERDKNELPSFPALSLVVSGGHTDLVHMNSVPQNVHNFVRLIGSTRDDAAGECFDKTARILGLGYPGGPAIAKCAKKYLNKKDNNEQSKELNLFPRPMIDSDDFDFSFSGLKTSVLNYVKETQKHDNDKLAAEVQEAIVDVLVEKSIRAIRKYKPKSFMLSGGVSANERLVEKFKKRIQAEKLEVKFFYPEARLATDNAAAIASAAYFVGKHVDWIAVTANPGIRVADRL